MLYTIYFQSTPVFIPGLSDATGAFYPDDTSFVYKELKGDDYVELTFSMSDYYEIPVGCTITVEGLTYTMYSKPAVTINNSGNYQLRCTFYAPYYEMNIFKHKDIIQHIQGDGAYTFDGPFLTSFYLTGNPQTHFERIISVLNYYKVLNNLSERWTIVGVPEDAEKTLQYDNISVLEAFQNICEEFNLEYIINNNTITVADSIEFYKSNPLSLSYGKDNGLLSGVTRSQDDAQRLSNINYVTGGTRNILDKNWAGETEGNYSFNKLHLPADGTKLWYDGHDFYDYEPSPLPYACFEFIVMAGRKAIGCTSDLGHNIFYESAVTLDNIYPSHTCTIYEAFLYSPGTGTYEKGPLWWIRIDPTYDIGILDYIKDTSYWLPSSSLEVEFQTGELVGKSFTVTHIPTEFEIHSALGRDGEYGQWLELQPMQDEYTGGWHPQPLVTDVFIPRIGNNFIINNLKMPTSYINEAEIRLMQEAIKDLYPKTQEVFTIEAKVDSIWSTKHWGEQELWDRLKIGAFIYFSDTKVQAASRLMRITSVKTYLSRLMAPEITLSTSTINNNSIKREVNKALAMQVQINHLDKSVSNIINNYAGGSDTFWDFD